MLLALALRVGLNPAPTHLGGEPLALTPLAERIRAAQGRYGALTPEDQLALARGRSARVAEELAQNPQTCHQASCVLAEHKDPWVRKCLARVTPHVDVRLALLSDVDFDVAKMALNTAEQVVLERAAVTPNARLRSVLARHGHLSAETACVLALDPDENVRCALAASTTLRFLGPLLLLAHDESTLVKRYVAAHHGLSSLALSEILSRDPDPHVRDDAGRYLRGPDDRFDVEFIRTHRDGPALLETVLARFDPEARAALEPSWSGSLRTLAETLEEFAPA